MATKTQMKILIVDDSAPNRSLMAKILDGLGYTNHVDSPDGMDALKKLNSDPFTLVLLDWNMPQMSGIDLLRTIKRSQTLRHVAVIMVTANGELENVKAAISLGVTDYIVKPVAANALKEKIDRLMLKFS